MPRPVLFLVTAATRAWSHFPLSRSPTLACRLGCSAFPFQLLETLSRLELFLIFFYVSTRHSSSAHLTVMSCAKRVLRMRGMFQAERPNQKRIFVGVSWVKETVLVIFLKYFGYASGYARHIAAPLCTHLCSKLVYID